MDNFSITFRLGSKHDKKKNVKFTVNTNIAEYGLDIEAAFDNWSARTERFTVEDFCEYVVSKDPVNLKCTPDYANCISR